MEKNKKTRKLSLLLILAIISLVVLISSFARYTGVAGTASDTAKVAKWNITLDAQTDSIFTHDFTTGLIANAGTDKIIAPGVSGSYDIALTNAGDVDAKITALTLTPTGATTLPLKYAVNDGAFGTLEQATTALTTIASTKTISAGASNVAFATLKWEWPYGTANEASATADAVDTKFGTNSVTDNRTEYTLTMSVTATQVQPGT